MAEKTVAETCALVAITAQRARGLRPVVGNRSPETAVVAVT